MHMIILSLFICCLFIAYLLRYRVCTYTSMELLLSTILSSTRFTVERHVVNDNNSKKIREDIKPVRDDEEPRDVRTCNYFSGAQFPGSIRARDCDAFLRVTRRGGHWSYAESSIVKQPGFCCDGRFFLSPYAKWGHFTARAPSNKNIYMDGKRNAHPRGEVPGKWTMSRKGNRNGGTGALRLMPFRLHRTVRLIVSWIAYFRYDGNIHRYNAWSTNRTIPYIDTIEMFKTEPAASIAGWFIFFRRVFAMPFLIRVRKQKFPKRRRLWTLGPNKDAAATRRGMFSK